MSSYVLDVILNNGKTVSIKIRSFSRRKDGTAEIILHTGDRMTFNPENTVIWGVRKDDGCETEDTTETASDYSS